MAKRPGRKSAAAMSVAPVEKRFATLRPPDTAPADVKRLFAELVASVPDGHFRLSDRDLLVRYCEAILVARATYPRAAEDKDAMHAWREAAKITASYSRTLRLAPSSRENSTTAGRREPVQGMSPAEFLKLVGDDAA